MSVLISNQELVDKTCRECGAKIKIAHYSPHPLEKEATGIAAQAWDKDEASGGIK